MSQQVFKLTQIEARKIWIEAQGLHTKTPFGKGPQATAAAVRQLGYVQIDTINVIERCHHHILFNRIPDYRREHLNLAQTHDKSVFEYWTHALSYVPTEDFMYFRPRMNRFKKSPSRWLSGVTGADTRKVLRLLRENGAITIRDIQDDTLVEKEHEWASKKPSKKALQKGFYSGDFVVSEREGMLKKYDLTLRHFGWKSLPKAATEKQYISYIIDRALRAQGVVSLDSVCYLVPALKPIVKAELESRVRRSLLVEVIIQGAEKIKHWAESELLLAKRSGGELTHILSPFDPMVIQRKKTEMLFGYQHIFEAYIPKKKRKFGYFCLPVLSGCEVIALLDLKTDREAEELLIQAWHWRPKQKTQAARKKIEEELHRFEKFQLV